MTHIDMSVRPEGPEIDGLEGPFVVRDKQGREEFRLDWGVCYAVSTAQKPDRVGVREYRIFGEVSSGVLITSVAGVVTV